MNLRIHSFLPCSYANGPGCRAVVWVQGCPLGCPGCFNPQTHRLDGGHWVEVEDLWHQIQRLGRQIEGLTLSGGEPLVQLTAVTELLRLARTGSKLSSLVFSGFTWEEIQRLAPARTSPAKGVGESPDNPPPRPPSTMVHRTRGPALLDYLDVLIAGRYEPRLRLARGLRGSANKTIHLLSSRYAMAEIEAAPEAEVILQSDGQLVLSGIDPLLETYALSAL